MGVNPLLQSSDPNNIRNPTSISAVQQAAAANRDMYQMPPNGYMPNGYMMHDPTAYQSQHNAYMSNYHRYDMGQMHNAAAGSLNSYMNATGYGMYGTVSGGQTSPYGSIQQPSSPYSSLQQQQPGSPYGLTQPGSQLSCQSHSPSDSSVKSEPVSPGPIIHSSTHSSQQDMRSNSGGSGTSNSNNNLIMKREYGQQPAGPDLNHIINMYHIPDAMSGSDHHVHQRNIMHYQNSVSPDLQQQHPSQHQQQQQHPALRTMPIAHM